MANEQNLMPIGLVNSRRSREQHSEDSRKGGQKSGEVRRKRKAMKEQMNLLLSLPFNLRDSKGQEIKKILATLGIEEDEINNQMAMMIALWKTAMKDGRNQVAAFQEIRKVVQDEDTASEDDKVQIIDDLPDDPLEFEEDNEEEEEEQNDETS